MGNAPYAKLVYGYDLDGSDEWKIREVGDFGEPQLSWFPEVIGEADDPRDFLDEADQRLLASVGFTETEWSEGYNDRKKAAEARLGVRFERYGGDPSSVVLAAKVVEVDWGSIPVDLGALVAEAAASDWDEKLLAALRVLDMTPTQEFPGWLLCAQYW